MYIYGEEIYIGDVYVPAPYILECSTPRKPAILKEICYAAAWYIYIYALGGPCLIDRAY